jgi:hypothetical protein
MATTVDTLVVRIEADMKDMRRALRRVEADVSKSTKKMSGAFGKLGKAMKFAVAAVVVRQGFIAGKAMVNLASDIEEMQGKSKVVFGKFRDGVVKELTAFGDAVGRSSHELEGMASTVQDTFVPMGFARGEAAKLSVELTKLAVDTASFNNASDTDTIKAFQSALVGNHETVRRFGVVITEATINQELLTMGVEGGTKAASNAQKVQARLNLITKGVADAQGDAARTSGSYANSMRGLKAEFSELAGSLGAVVLPAITKIINAMKEGVKRAKELAENIGLISMPAPKEIDKANNALIKHMAVLENYRKLASPDAADQLMYSSLLGAGMGDDQVAAGIAREEKNIRLLRKRRDELAFKLKADAEKQFIPLKGKGGDGGDSEARKQQLKDFLDLRRLTTANAELNKLLNKSKKSGLDIDIEQYHWTKDYLDLKQKFPELSDPELKKQLDLLQTMREQTSETKKQIDLEDVAAEKKAKRKAQVDDAVLSAKKFLNPDAVAMKEIEEIKHGLDVLLFAGKKKDPAGITDVEHVEALQKLREEIRLMEPAYVQMVDRIQSAADTMSDSLTQMVMDGKINFGTMKDMFKDMVRQMIADALKAQVIKPLLGAVFGGIGGAFGGSSVGGGTNIGNAFLNVAEGFKNKASGGTIQGGNPYLVGERGPELIVPSSAGTIMNNHNTKNAMGRGGGTVVNQTINVQSGVAQTVRAEMISLLPRFKQDTMNAVVDAKRRGGSFGQAFG